jgi:predicted nucleotidyltransferase
MKIKTIFDDNRHIINKTLYTQNDTNNKTTKNPIIINEDIYKVLATYSEIIQNLLFQFSLGNFQQVANILNRKYFEYLSKKISMISYIDYPIYEQLRLSIKKSLQGLYKAVEQYENLIDTQSKLKTTQERASILDDMKKLKDYITSLKQNISLFPDMNVTILRAEIKPEYAEYIRLYGYPKGGIFDMDKLGDILIKIELNTLI